MPCSGLTSFSIRLANQLEMMSITVVLKDDDMIKFLKKVNGFAFFLSRADYDGQLNGVDVAACDTFPLALCVVLAVNLTESVPACSWNLCTSSKND